MMIEDSVAVKPSRCEPVSIRGLPYNLRRWGDGDAPPLVLLHGTRDSSVSFQFLVDHLKQEWCVIAPDWRGHGLSARTPQGYWLHEFVADLDAIFDLVIGERKVPLVGHSLGGNVAGVFAGLRSNRLSCVVSLDGTGPLSNHIPVDMHATLRQLLGHRSPRVGKTGYAGVEQMAERLMRANRRLDRAKALFLAGHSSVRVGEVWHWRFDAAFQRSLPTFHSLEEWHDIWRHIEVPVLWILSEDLRPLAATSSPAELDRRKAMIRDLTVETVPGTGHNLHHDEPARVAELVESFILRNASSRRRESREGSAVISHA